MSGDGFFDGDADIEYAALCDTADRESRLAKRGICAHGWRQGRPDGSVECLYCHEVFASEEAADDARAEVLD